MYYLIYYLLILNIIGNMKVVYKIINKKIYLMNGVEDIIVIMLMELNNL